MHSSNTEKTGYEASGDYEGGEDVHPSLYNRPEFLSLCNPNFMDERRDEFEWKVCEYIFKNQVPVLGICRGLQLINVFLGELWKDWSLTSLILLGSTPLTQQNLIRWLSEAEANEATI
eukprot:gene26358-31842_t